MESDLSWRVPLFIQCVIGAILAAGSLVMPESPRYAHIACPGSVTACSRVRRTVRWLIDVDRDDEGMRVIADLHGGDPEDLIAKAEFQEIKDRVIFEVCMSSRQSGRCR